MVASRLVALGLLALLAFSVVPATVAASAPSSGDQLVEVLWRAVKGVEEYLASHNVPAGHISWLLLAKARKAVEQVEKLVEEGRSAEAWKLAGKVFSLLSKAIEEAKHHRPRSGLALVAARAKALAAAASRLYHRVQVLAGRGLLGEEDAARLAAKLNETRSMLLAVVEAARKAAREGGEFNYTWALEVLREAGKTLASVRQVVGQAELRAASIRLASMLEKRAKALLALAEKLRERASEAAQENMTVASERLLEVAKLVEEYAGLLQDMAENLTSSNLTARELRILHRLALLTATLHPVLKPPKPVPPAHELAKLLLAASKKLREAARAPGLPPKTARTLARTAGMLSVAAKLLGKAAREPWHAKDLVARALHIVAEAHKQLRMLKAKPPAARQVEKLLEKILERAHTRIPTRAHLVFVKLARILLLLERCTRNTTAHSLATEALKALREAHKAAHEKDKAKLVESLEKLVKLLEELEKTPGTPDRARKLAALAEKVARLILAKLQE